MREQQRSRFLYALVFALAAAAFVSFANPVDRIKADVRADTKGFVLSLEYSANLLKL